MNDIDYYKDEIHCLYEEKKELQQRIDKAIEYIEIHKSEVNKSQADLFNTDRKKKTKLKIGTFMWGIDELLNILRGNDE